MPETTIPIVIGADVRPISEALDRALDAAAEQIPASSKGAATVTASLQGAEAEVGWRLRPTWTVSAYGAAEWATGRKTAGVRSRWTW